jgi:hypothetical protein
MGMYSSNFNITISSFYLKKIEIQSKYKIVSYKIKF